MKNKKITQLQFSSVSSAIGTGLNQSKYLKKFSIDSPIPHIGWCMVKKNKNSIVNDSFETNLYNKYYYFAHGLICNFKKKYKFTKFIYGNKSFVASVRHKNLIGTQFHPELSGSMGLDIYKFFLDK